MNAPRSSIVLLTAFAVLLGGCRFTPWEGDPGCTDYLTGNLAALQAIEAADPAPSQFNVALIADVHNDLTDLETIVTRINERDDIAFVLVLGDITNSGLAIEFGFSCERLVELDVPRFYTIGNHDAISYGADIFQEHFAPLDYAFSHRGARFVVYNDNAYEFPGVPDYGFMRDAAALEAGEMRTHTVGVAHPPPLADVHPQDEIDELRRFLADAGFDVTVHGHRHVFDLWESEYGVLHMISHETNGAVYGLMTLSRDGGIAFQGCGDSCFPLELNPEPVP